MLRFGQGTALKVHKSYVELFWTSFTLGSPKAPKKLEKRVMLLCVFKLMGKVVLVYLFRYFLILDSNDKL